MRSREKMARSLSVRGDEIDPKNSQVVSVHLHAKNLLQYSE